jgi:hypothetical protein
MVLLTSVVSPDDVCRETLALVKMDWNNDGPYDRLPATLNFAGTLATIVKRVPKFQPHSYSASVIGIVAASLANSAARKFFYAMLRRPHLAC